MKKIITDHFDKLLMTLIFFVMFFAALIYSFEWLANLTRDAFLVLTALLGFRRQPAASANTTTGDINVQPGSENLNNLTDDEITGAVSTLKEEK